MSRLIDPKCAYVTPKLSVLRMDVSACALGRMPAGRLPQRPSGLLSGSQSQPRRSVYAQPGKARGGPASPIQGRSEVAQAQLVEPRNKVDVDVHFILYDKPGHGIHTVTKHRSDAFNGIAGLGGITREVDVPKDVHYRLKQVFREAWKSLKKTCAEDYDCEAEHLHQVGSSWSILTQESVGGDGQMHEQKSELPAWEWQNLGTLLENGPAGAKIIIRCAVGTWDPETPLAEVARRAKLACTNDTGSTMIRKDSVMSSPPSPDKAQIQESVMGKPRKRCTDVRGIKRAALFETKSHPDAELERPRKRRRLVRGKQGTPLSKLKAEDEYSQEQTEYQQPRKRRRLVRGLRPRASSEVEVED